MSETERPNGRPVKPPMPNIGKNASAKSIGVLKRIEPPHKEINKQDKITTEGIEIIIVVAWKNELIAVPIPVRNI